MKAQQSYDLYDFIANKPRGGRKVLNEAIVDDRMQDRMSRFFFGAAPDGSAPVRSKGRARPLVKLVVKAAAAIPVLILYVGPRKVAHVVKPILQKVAHLIPHLFQLMQQKLQGQLKRIEPFINRVRVTMEKAVKLIKRSVAPLHNALNRAGTFITQQIFDPLKRWSGQLTSALKNLLPTKLFPKQRLTLHTPYDLTAAGLLFLKGFFSRHLGAVVRDIRGELNDLKGLLSKAKSFLARLTPTIPSFKFGIPDGIKSSISRVNEQLKEQWKRRITDPLDRAKEKVTDKADEVKQKVAEVTQAVVAQIQVIVAPAINLLAATQQLFQKEKERIGRSIRSWLQQKQKGLKRFFERTGQLVGRGLNAVQKGVDTMIHSFQRFASLLERLHHRLVKSFLWLIAFLKQKIVELVRLIAKLLKLALKAVRFVLLQLPQWIYRAVEWAFGRVGVLILNVVTVFFTGLIKAFRYVNNILREVIIELVKQS